MDKRVFALGIAMLATGIVVLFYLNNTEPLGKPEMTQEETDAFNQALVLNTGFKNISQLVAGLGFFITLISLGLKRRKKGGVGKPVTQKPAEI